MPKVTCPNGTLEYGPGHPTALICDQMRITRLNLELVPSFDLTGCGHPYRDLSAALCGHAGRRRLGLARRRHSQRQPDLSPSVQYSASSVGRAARRSVAIDSPLWQNTAIRKGDKGEGER
jgi:hypothetical protein